MGPLLTHFLISQGTRGALRLAGLSSFLGQHLPASQLRITIIGWASFVAAIVLLVLLALGGPTMLATLVVAMLGVIIALSNARRDAVLIRSDAAQIVLWYTEMMEDWGALTPEQRASVARATVALAHAVTLYRTIP